MSIIAQVTQKSAAFTHQEVEEQLEQVIQGAMLGIFGWNDLPPAEELRSLLDDAMSLGTVRAIEQLCQQYTTQVVGAERYQRAASRANRRSGMRSRTIILWQRSLEIR